MHTRTARSRAEIDLLPPFGKPEVVVVGQAAWVVAIVVAYLMLLRFRR